MDCGFSWLNSYYQSPDWVKALWVLSLPSFVLALSALGLWFFLSWKRLRLEERRLGLEGAKVLPSAPAYGEVTETALPGA